MVGLGHLYQWMQHLITFERWNKCCKELFLSNNELMLPLLELGNGNILEILNGNILEILKIINFSCFVTLPD